MTVTLEQRSASAGPRYPAEPFDLTVHALERLARDAGAEDANAVRRVLRAYWFSSERKSRDAALVDHALRVVERVLERELPHELAQRVARTARHEDVGSI
jgi:hypothetical protein